MTREEFIDQIEKYSEIIAICEFGSYRTQYWIKDRSDIDLIIIVGPNVTFLDTLYIEDEINKIAKEFYKYDKVHLTFLLYNDFSNKFARIAIDSEVQYILNEERWYDFNRYVLKSIRNNDKLEKILRIDEQYSYFGGVVDESIL